MSKVVVDICPTNQEENCEAQCFPSKDKQAESEEYGFRPRTMADREIASCDSQTALIDNLTTNLNNSVYSPSNAEENKMERYDLRFDQKLTHFNCIIILLLNLSIYISF